MESADKYDAAVFLKTQFVWAFGVALDISPLGSIDLPLIKELVVSSDNNFGLALLVLRSEKASCVGWEVVTLVVPILKPP